MITLRYVTKSGQFHCVGTPRSIDLLYSILLKDTNILVLEILDMNGTRLEYRIR